MAELIKKDEAKKEMWWLFNNYVNNASNFEPEETEAVNRSFGRLQNVIDNMPTTTESEIREKAISDFLKALEEHTQKNWIDHHDYGITWTDLEEIAEQLKEDK